MGGGSACQCSDHMPHTASNRSAWLSSQKEASSKDDALAEDKQTKDMDSWNHILWSDETKKNLFVSDGVKRVWRQQKVSSTKTRFKVQGLFIRHILNYTGYNQK